MLQNDVLRLAAPLLCLSELFGANWSTKVPRNRRFLQLTWRIVVLLLNAVPNSYVFIQRTTPHFKILFYTPQNQSPVNSIIAILDRFNKLFFSVIQHLLLVWTTEETMKKFFNQLEPLYRALQRPTLSNIRFFSNWTITWLSFSVSMILQK